jgi:predicted PurR-regulated permease PerM
MGQSMDMPPITVMVCLMFWGAIWGIIGAILSVPLTVTIVTYLKTIDHPMPKFLASLITGDFDLFNEDLKPSEKTS